MNTLPALPNSKVSDKSKTNNAISVIVVDDSNFMRRQIVKQLQEKHFNVVAEFASAKPALEYLASHAVNIAIIDVVMPEVSGIELTQKISATLARTKVIMISSLAQERVILEAIAAGAQDFLQKPVNEKHLEDSIQRIAHAAS
jgi:two-component system chemotaxis response regulator CheY